MFKRFHIRYNETSMITIITQNNHYKRVIPMYIGKYL